jgi:hypothetical protein
MDEVLARTMTRNLEPIEWDETTITTAGAPDETLVEEESSTLTARSTIATNLARKTVVGVSAVQKIESGDLAASLTKIVAIQATFAAEGIEFNDDGDISDVRLLPRKWRT